MLLSASFCEFFVDIIQIEPFGVPILSCNIMMIATFLA
nr:MAG TPA: hypothetical protein [Caudoviricetes sp.]